MFRRVARLEQPDFPMTFRHFHFRAIPVAEEGARPRDVLTWQRGVLDGSPDGWAELEKKIRASWPP